MNNFLIHVGAPKCGSTSLQVLFENLSDVYFLGKPFDTDRSVPYETNRSLAELVEQVRLADSFAFNEQRADKLFEEGVLSRKKDASAHSLTVLSEEALSQANGCDRRLIAERLKRLFGSAKILICIREQISTLESAFRWLYTRNMSEPTVRQWIQQRTEISHRQQIKRDFMLRQYQYASLVSSYCEIFGRDKVFLLPIELLNQEAATANRALADFMGLEEKTVTDAFAKVGRQNKSLSLRAAQYQRFVRHTYFRCSKLPILQVQPITHLGLITSSPHKQVTDFLDRGWGWPSISECQKEALLQQYFVEDNQKLQTLTDIDLHELGYKMVGKP